MALTFDDGYADNLINAKPLLERYGIPATVFVASGYVGAKDPFWWDRLQHVFLEPGVLPRKLGIAVNGLTTGMIVGSVALLIKALPEHKEAPGALLRSASALWITNILVFAAWYANELRDAPQPVSTAAARGREVFLSAACPLCHTIRGTPSGGAVAPDLTHLATRSTLAAGTIHNDRIGLSGWIANAQGIKPGNQMPANLVSGRDLNALLDYLGTLR